MSFFVVADLFASHFLCRLWKLGEHVAPASLAPNRWLSSAFPDYPEVYPTIIGALVSTSTTVLINMTSSVEPYLEFYDLALPVSIVVIGV